ncbi:unnamed protein product, partial [Mesorhabditis belari]|uniref:PX domain-containing protein n=1 Tax=Mesorhabditis belari TaxID=2138241 RepID=A0AAF3ETQ2_9BILA
MESPETSISNLIIPDVSTLDFLQYSEPDFLNPYLRSCRLQNTWKLAKSNGVEGMIHISVPDTQTLVERKDGLSKYTAYNIHVNGWFHAAVRFSVLHQFSETLRNRFGAKLKGPEFPPKKIFRNLDGPGLEERRIKISKYLQSLVQSPQIARDFYIEKTFLDFQIEYFRPTCSTVSLDILLADGEKITVKCNVRSSTSEVLEILCEKLEVESSRLKSYFGLFVGSPKSLMEEEGTSSSEGFDLLVIRLLRNFESPYASLQLMNQRSAARGIHHKLTLQKLIWDPRIEESLLDDRVFTRLLYAQAKSDFHCKRLRIQRKETLEKLQNLEKQENMAQFIRACHLFPSYGMEELGKCRSDYPRPDSVVSVSMGRRQILFKYRHEGQNIEEAFRATRIRVWRISSPPRPNDPLIFQFEYLLSKDTFQWITLFTEQAILISLLLQSIGSEILNEYKNSLFNDEACEKIEVHESNGHRKPLIQKADSPLIDKREEKKRNSISSNTSDSTFSQNDPLGAPIYESFSDVFTTITDTLPPYSHEMRISAVECTTLKESHFDLEVAEGARYVMDTKAVNVAAQVVKNMYIHSESPPKAFFNRLQDQGQFDSCYARKAMPKKNVVRSWYQLQTVADMEKYISWYWLATFR